MGKAEIVADVQAKVGIKSKGEASKAVDAILAVIQESLSIGEDIVLTGFDSFKVTNRKERVGKNPKTGESIKIPATKAVKFVPSKGLKESVK